MSNPKQAEDEWARKMRRDLARKRIRRGAVRMTEAVEGASSAFRELSEELDKASGILPGRRPL